MLLSVHVVTGAAVAVVIRDPTLIPPLCFATHLVMDMLPHWNFPIPKGKSLGQFVESFGPDLFATILVYLGLLLWHPELWWLTSWGVFWTVLPDFLTLFRKDKPWRLWLRGYYKLHNALQTEVQPSIGLIMQAFVVFICIIILRSA
ncbi:MAG: hypothetical protein WCV85_03230 [Patescibacteria group bacterium]|jgi:hypothetical protein